MDLKVLQEEFAICKVKDFSQINLEDDFVFVGKTDEENSVVCRLDSIPENNIICEKGWKCFRVQGELDFSLIGIISKISSLLAENKISIFAVSTYNTDYILVKKEDFNKTVNVLSEQGYHFI